MDEVGVIALLIVGIDYMAMFVADPSKKPTDIYLYTLHRTRVAMLTEGATDAEKALAGQHWMYSVDLLKKGVIIFAGRTLDMTADSFATVVIRAVFRSRGAQDWRVRCRGEGRPVSSARVSLSGHADGDAAVTRATGERCIRRARDISSSGPHNPECGHFAV